MLDENFNPDYQHFENGNGISDWESAVTNPAISEIIEHPSKIYSSRIEKNGKIYDICAVSRKDKRDLSLPFVIKTETLLHPINLLLRICSQAMRKIQTANFI